MQKHTQSTLVGAITCAIAAVSMLSTAIPVSAAQPWLWPTESKTISYGFKVADSTSHFSGHYGIDIDGATGDDVYASRGGVVASVADTEGSGKTITIIHGARGQWQTTYRHLDTIAVTVGQRVTRGQVIGTLGSTGHTTGDLLHFELSRKVDGEWKFANPANRVAR